MDSTAKTETDLVVLKRIVALLFAFADLADRAHGLPFPARRLLLWILRPAEAIARAFVAGPMDGLENFRPLAADNDDFSDALALAASFRMLACMLESQMADDLWLAWWPRFSAGQTLLKLAPTGHGRADILRLLALPGLTPRLDTS